MGDEVLLHFLNHCSWILLDMASLVQLQQILEALEIFLNAINFTHDFFEIHLIVIYFGFMATCLIREITNILHKLFNLLSSIPIIRNSYGHKV